MPVFGFKGQFNVLLLEYLLIILIAPYWSPRLFVCGIWKMSRLTSSCIGIRVNMNHTNVCIHFLVDMWINIRGISYGSHTCQLHWVCTLFFPQKVVTSPSSFSLIQYLICSITHDDDLEYHLLFSSWCYSYIGNTLHLGRHSKQLVGTRIQHQVFL